MSRHRKSMICAGVIAEVNVTPHEAFADLPGVDMIATVRFDDRLISQRFRLVFVMSDTIFVLGEPVFVEYRKVNGEWRFFDVRRSLRRERGTT